MKADRHLYRTGDGRLVTEGHDDAAFLAYTPGDDIAPADRAKVPGAQDEAEDEDDGPPEPEAARRPADKSRRKPGDK